MINIVDDQEDSRIKIIELYTFIIPLASSKQELEWQSILSRHTPVSPILPPHHWEGKKNSSPPPLLWHE